MSSTTDKISDYLGGLFHEFRCTNTENENEGPNIADMLHKMHNDFEAALPSGRDFRTFVLYNVKPDDIEVFMVGDDVKIRAKSVTPTQFGSTTKTTAYSFCLPTNADKSTIKSSFDADRGCLKIEWGYGGKSMPEPVDEPKQNDEPKTSPKDPSSENPSSVDPSSEEPTSSDAGKDKFKNRLQSLVGKGAKGSYRFSPIRPKTKRVKRPSPNAPAIEEEPEIEPIPEGPNADDLKDDIRKCLANCDDTEKLEEILSMLE